MERFLVVRPWKRKRKSKQKETRSLESVNLENVCELVGTNKVVSHRKGLFFVGDEALERHLVKSLEAKRVNVESFSLSFMIESTDRLKEVIDRVLSEAEIESCSLALTCNQVFFFFFFFFFLFFFFLLFLRCKELIHGLRPNVLFANVTKLLGNMYDKENDDVQLVIDVSDNFLFVGVKTLVENGLKHVLTALERHVRQFSTAWCVVVKYGEVYLRGANRADCLQNLRHAVSCRLGSLAKAVVVLHDQCLVAVPSNGVGEPSEMERLCASELFVLFKG
jgi:hypothetical protein